MTQFREQFGRGILRPFQRDGKGDFSNESGMRLLKSDIAQLLAIRGPTLTSPGELPWDTDRGSRMDSLRHRHMHSEMVRAMAEQYAAGPIRKDEKRVDMGRVAVEIEDDQTLRVDVSFAPKGTQFGELETVPIYPETGATR